MIFVYFYVLFIYFTNFKESRMFGLVNRCLRPTDIINHYCLHQTIRNLNCNTASITKIHRLKYMRMYPTVIVLPDGSSVTARYYEPRQIITLPLDLTTLSEEQRKARLEKRRPKTKVKDTVEIEEDFNVDDYLKLIKK